MFFSMADHECWQVVCSLCQLFTQCLTFEHQLWSQCLCLLCRICVYFDQNKHVTLTDLRHICVKWRMTSQQWSISPVVFPWFTSAWHQQVSLCYSNTIWYFKPETFQHGIKLLHPAEYYGDVCGWTPVSTKTNWMQSEIPLSNMPIVFTIYRWLWTGSFPEKFDEYGCLIGCP